MKAIIWLVFVGIISAMGAAYAFLLFAALFGTQVIFDWVGRDTFWEEDWEGGWDE